MNLKIFTRGHAILRQVCPKCERGKPFRGIMDMRTTCEVCHLTFEREEGYWTGAMLINWLLVSFTLGPIWIVMLLRGVPFPATLLVTLLLLIVLLPLFFRYSRVIWLYIDHTVDSGER